MNKIKNMNKKITAIVFTFLILLNFNSVAETNYPNTSIAIVDLNLILSESKAAKNATKYQHVNKAFECVKTIRCWSTVLCPPGRYRHPQRLKRNLMQCLLSLQVWKKKDGV